MQTIIHDSNIHQVFNQIESLYARISSDDSPKLFQMMLDNSFQELCEILDGNIDRFEMPNFKDFKFTPIDTVHEDGTIIVCISGGKDSVALSKMLIDLGYNVHLYHMRGINKVYYDEFEAVQKIAKYLNVPCYIDTVALCGTQSFIEHPMKNYIIANGAIQYAIKQGLPPNIAFGNFSDSYLSDNDFDVCAGDCMDMWYAYDNIIQTIIPDFRMKIFLHNNEESMEIIKQDPKLLEVCMSCISPYRFREHWKKRTEKKYSIKLMPHRCGCCWKCCLEYIYYTDADIFIYNEPYYLHCVEVLYHTKVKETQDTDWTIEELWNEYIPYSMRESKAWERLENATISNGKIKYI